jgi:hypothetical protein
MLGLALAVLLAAPASTAAFHTGEVQLAVPKKTGFELWDYRSEWNVNYTMASGGCVLIYKCVFYASGHFVIPTPNGVIFEDSKTISFWDGTLTYYGLPGKGYTDIFSDDSELGEIAPARSGRFLVAERSADRARGARLIEFTLQGRVKDHVFPELLDPNGRALGARHIELLADGCTLLYTNGSDDANGNRVRRMNICTDTAETDFATLIAGQYAGAIRQMPDGNVIVANGSGIFRFNSDGSLIRTYDFLGVTHVALTSSGDGFWAGGANDGAPQLRFYGNGSSIRIGNPEMQPPASADEVSDLVVAGEWRAAVAGPPRRRAAH